MNDVKVYYKSELEEATSALGLLEECLNQASNESTNNIDLQSTRKKVCEPAGSRVSVVHSTILASLSGLPRLMVKFHEINVQYFETASKGGQGCHVESRFAK